MSIVDLQSLKGFLLESNFAKGVKATDKAAKRRLSVVEDDQVDNCKGQRRSSVALVPLHKPHPVKISKRRESFPICISKPLEVKQVPVDVTPIDSDEENFPQYGSDIMIYMRQRERLFNEAIKRGSDLSVDIKNRNKLSNWLLEVLEYVKAGQTTVYNAINMVDRSLATFAVKSNELQLLGITCVWIATKLEEYYSADVQSLLKCTMNSYRVHQVLQMERNICKGLDFACYGEEPTHFVDRLVLAAGFQDHLMFQELCMLLLDLMVADFEIWQKFASLKSAASVYTALHFFHEARHKKKEVWTKNLIFYSGYQEKDLIEISLSIMDKLNSIVKTMTLFNRKKLIDERQNFGNESAIIFKYLSRTRHQSILLDEILDIAVVDQVLSRIWQRSKLMTE